MKEKILHVRITEDLHKQLEKEAKIENRTIANLVRHILIKYLEERK